MHSIPDLKKLISVFSFDYYVFFYYALASSSARFLIITTVLGSALVCLSSHAYEGIHCETLMQGTMPLRN